MSFYCIPYESGLLGGNECQKLEMITRGHITPTSILNSVLSLRFLRIRMALAVKSNMHTPSIIQA